MSQSPFFEGVPYLEETDFNANGTLKPYVGNGKPVVVMIQSSWCGHCKNAKPAYQQAFDKCKDVVFATVQADSPVESCKKALKYTPNEGFPTFLKYDRSGKLVGPHTGNRDAESIIAFGRA